MHEFASYTALAPLLGRPVPPADTSQISPLYQRGYFDQSNDVSHLKLTERSYQKLTAKLTAFGNQLDRDHKTALYSLVASMTEMAQGTLQGRWAFGLPTGMGKTTAVICWIATLHELGLDHIAVAVSAAKVEELCKLKRALVAEGVPASKVGIVHSYKWDPDPQKRKQDGYASEPSDGPVDRQIMLVSHARVRDPEKLAQFAKYQGRGRDLLIYDESLIVADSVGISIRDLRGAVGYLTGIAEDEPKKAPALAFLRDCLALINAALKEVKETEATCLRTMPLQDEQTCQQYRSALGAHPALDPAHQLLALAGEPVRVVPTGQGGTVWFEVSVPQELENVFILDASYPIRRLIQLDRSIQNAERLPQIRKIGKPLSQIKRFDNVTIRQMFRGGGRATMAGDFQQSAMDRATTKEIANVVRQIPMHEGILVFVYKTRPTDRIDYRSILLRDLEAAGIDTTAEVTGLDGKPRRRIEVQTWGNETASNDWAYCRHVILAGVLQRSPVDLAAARLGQVGSLSDRYDETEIRELATSEVCHAIYQALSRGSCRSAELGQAKPMTGYIIHRSDSIRPVLSKVMPGVRWEEWAPKDRQGKAGKTGLEASAALQIGNYLDGLAPSVTTVSARKLKEEAGLLHLHPQAFTRALSRGLGASRGWHRDGRSVVRT